MRIIKLIQEWFIARREAKLERERKRLNREVSNMMSRKPITTNNPQSVFRFFLPSRRNLWPNESAGIIGIVGA